MGLGAMKLAEMEEYIRVVYGLLAGEIVETEIEGKQHKIHFVNPDAGLFNTTDPDPLAHLGLRAAPRKKLTARLNAGIGNALSRTYPARSDAGRRDERTKLGGSGHAAKDLYATAWVCGCVLQPGEPLDQVRAPSPSPASARRDHSSTAPPMPSSRAGRTR